MPNYRIREIRIVVPLNSEHTRETVKAHDLMRSDNIIENEDNEVLDITSIKRRIRDEQPD